MPVIALRREEDANNEPTPTFFIGIPSSILSNVCACVLSTTIETAAATKTVSIVTGRTASVCLIRTLRCLKFNMTLDHGDFNSDLFSNDNYWGKNNGAEQRALESFLDWNNFYLVFLNWLL